MAAGAALRFAGVFLRAGKNQELHVQPSRSAPSGPCRNDAAAKGPVETVAIRSYGEAAGELTLLSAKM
jgi:hypothetical protein